MEAVTSSLRLASSSSLVTVSERLKLRVENFAGGKAYLGITFESLTLKCGCERWSNGAFQVAAQAAATEVAGNAASPKSRCECHDLFEHLVPYVEAWRWQKETLDRISTSLSKGEEPPNSVVLLQHPPVYTMGTRSSDVYLRFDKNHPPFELHQTERGGEVTYHGPGQLVMYPILNLRRQRMDLHWYLRMLEEVVIRALWSSCGLRASRVEGLTGVWVGDAKVAAIGVRVSRWITYHGLALNVNTDLAPFQNIVPCGIGDRPVGSIKQLLQNIQLNSSRGTQPLQTFEGGGWHDLLEDAMILDRVHESLLLEFAEVFQMDLISPINEGPKCVLHPQTDLHEENMKLS